MALLTTRGCVGVKNYDNTWILYKGFSRHPVIRSALLGNARNCDEICLVADT